MQLNDVFEGIAVGLLAGLVLVYALRPKVPYPAWMVSIFEQPWIFLVLAIFAVSVFLWSRVVGALLVLIIIALYADMVVFARPPPQKGDAKGKPSADVAGNADKITGYSIQRGADLVHGFDVEKHAPFKTTLDSEASVSPMFATHVNPAQFVPGRPTDDADREGPSLRGTPIDVRNYSLFPKLSEEDLQPGDADLF